MDDRVFVTLKRNDEGYPPWDEEEIWAEPAGSDLFRLDASPTFAKGLSYRDVVHVVAVGERWYIDRVVESHGHSTIRAILFDDEHHDRLQSLCREHGCDADHTEVQGLFAIDVPPDKNYNELVKELTEGHRNGFWDYEVGAVSAHHDR